MKRIKHFIWLQLTKLRDKNTKLWNILDPIRNMLLGTRRYSVYKYKSYEKSFYFYPVTKEAQEHMEKTDPFISQR